MKNMRKYTLFVLLLALLLCVGCGAAPDDGSAEYKVSFADQNGNAVEGVTLQVCDDSSCMIFTSDAKGVCSFELPASEYELHILKLPEGYEGDLEEIKLVSPKALEAEFVLVKK